MRNNQLVASLLAMRNTQPLAPRPEARTEEQQRSYQNGLNAALRLWTQARDKCLYGSGAWARLDRSVRSLSAASSRSAFGSQVCDRLAQLGRLHSLASGLLEHNMPDNPHMQECIKVLNNAIVDIGRNGGDCSASRGHGMMGWDDGTAAGRAMEQSLRRADSAIVFADRLTRERAGERLERHLRQLPAPMICRRDKKPDGMPAC